MSKWIVNGLAIAIILLWVISCLMAIFNPDFRPPDSVQWAISILAGAAFGKAAVESAGKHRPP